MHCLCSCHMATSQQLRPSRAISLRTAFAVLGTRLQRSGTRLSDVKASSFVEEQTKPPENLLVFVKARGGRP